MRFSSSDNDINTGNNKCFSKLISANQTDKDGLREQVINALLFLPGKKVGEVLVHRWRRRRRNGEDYVE